MFSHFWRRLGKLALFAILSYLFLAYVLVFSIILRQEFTIFEATRVISVFNPQKGECTLKGQVRNVFGDVIPHAVVIVGNYITQADNMGVYSLTNLEEGRYKMEILAGDYEHYQKEVQLEPGTNTPTIKYDSGLWPQVFLVDFHIFFKEHNQIFGMLGFANGTEQELYIERATLLSPTGEVITDLLHDGDGFAYYLDLSNKLELVEEPQKALKWAPRMVQNGEFAPIEGYFRPGPYSLEVHYAFEEGHKLGQYQIFTITDHLDLANDWNPHLPNDVPNPENAI